MIKVRGAGLATLIRQLRARDDVIVIDQAWRYLTLYAGTFTWKAIEARITRARKQIARTDDIKPDNKHVMMAYTIKRSRVGTVTARIEGVSSALALRDILHGLGYIVALQTRETYVIATLDADLWLSMRSKLEGVAEILTRKGQRRSTVRPNMTR